MGFIFKSRKQREEDKELKEYYEEIDRIHKELDEEDKKNRIKFTDLFKKDPFEEELRQYMSKEQLIEEEKDKKKIKKMTILSIVTLSLSFAAIIGVMLYIGYVFRSDLEKIHKTDMINYYKDNYGVNLKISDINYICDKKKDEDCSNKIKAVTESNQIIYKIDDKYYDNIYTSSYYDEYNNYIRSLNNNISVFWNSPLIYDNDMNPKFHPFNEDINVLPSKGSLYELLEQGKLGVIDIFMYQGELNTEAIQEFINSLDVGSRLFFIKNVNGIPKEINYYFKDNHIDIPIVDTQTVNEVFTIYNFDNSIGNYNLELTKHNAESILTINDKYRFNSAYTIHVNNKPKNSSGIYFITIKDSINYNNLAQFKDGVEIDKDKYQYTYIASYGGITYVFGNNDISFGTKSEVKNSIF